MAAVAPLYVPPPPSVSPPVELSVVTLNSDVVSQETGSVDNVTSGGLDVGDVTSGGSDVGDVTSGGSDVGDVVFWSSASTDVRKTETDNRMRG